MRHLNPFYILEKQVLPELVLLVRLLAVYLLLTREFPFRGNQGGGRFFPLIGFIEKIGSDSQFNLGVNILFLTGIVILLFSSWVRAGSFLVGSAFLIGMVSCLTCISVAHMFTACLFICTALSNIQTGTELVRFQLIVLYLGADLNKIVDKDWWTGASMETLLATKHQIPAYLTATQLFPPMVLSQLMGVGVMVLQLGIAVLLLNKRLLHYAILAAMLLHLPMVLLMQMTFGPFLTALVLAYAVLLSWPPKLQYDSAVHSPVLVTLLKFFDFNGQIEMDFQKGGPETAAKWFRTILYFVPHPCILLFLIMLSAVFIHYGKLLPLGALLIYLFYLRVWLPRKRGMPDVRKHASFS